MSNGQSQQREPGLPCPSCGFFMSMPIRDLLYKSRFVCPGCGLELVMDRGGSLESLRMLQQMHVAMENLKATRKQSL